MDLADDNLALLHGKVEHSCHSVAASALGHTGNWGLWLSASLEEIIAHSLIQGKDPDAKFKGPFSRMKIAFVPLSNPNIRVPNGSESVTVYFLCGKHFPKHFLHIFYPHNPMRLSTVQGRHRLKDQVALSTSLCLNDHELSSENHLDEHEFEVTVSLSPLEIRDR